MTYPRIRMRRRRVAEWMRNLAAETSLSAADFIWPVFVHAHTSDAPVKSMPGVSRLSLDGLWRAGEQACQLNIPVMAVFPAIDASLKSANGEEAFNPDGLIPQAIAGLKKRFPTLGVMTDVALDPYTDHGQDGIVNDEGEILNDETIVALQKQALTQAAAGTDIVAPSDMMDGRVGALRDVLEESGHQKTCILSYAAKYASAFYGPFRDAANTASALGRADKKTYQMDPRNIREALEEMALDLEEGADMLMVKPGMPYLDVITEAAREFECPVLAYQVSGEYAMLHAAAANGWLDGDKCMLESLMAFKRAGARAVLTYHAPQAAKLLQEA